MNQTLLFRRFTNTFDIGTDQSAHSTLSILHQTVGAQNTLPFYHSFDLLRSGKISWAPESLLDDSFMVYTSSEECEEVASAQAQLPPRPPSSR